MKSLTLIQLGYYLAHFYPGNPLSWLQVLLGAFGYLLFMALVSKFFKRK